MGAIDWRGLVQQALEIPSAHVNAQMFVRDWPSFSKPVALECDDGNTYVVKRRDLLKPACNEQVIAHLAMVIDAPVPHPQLVNLSAEFIASEPRVAHFQPGVAHGVKWIDGCSDRMWLEYGHVPENKPRFAGLALLYGWVGAHEDHQVIYENAPPNLVHSVDHGHFIAPAGRAGNWDIQALAAAGQAEPFATIITGCGITPEDVRNAGSRMNDITPEEVAAAVARPGDDWGITLDERVALAEYLWRRRSDLLPHVTPAAAA